VAAEQRAERLADLGLAGAERTAQHQRGFRLDARLLKDLRPPAHHPQKRRLVAARRVVLHVRQEFRAVALTRLYREALP